MCPHEVDDLGYPLDPELDKLELLLCKLATRWWISHEDKEKQQQVLQEYHTTMAKLYSLGWDGLLDLECELADEFMPEEYRLRHPRPPGPSNWFGIRKSTDDSGTDSKD